MKLHEFQEMVKAQREASKAEALSVLSATIQNTNERKTDENNK